MHNCSRVRVARTDLSPDDCHERVDGLEKAHAKLKVAGVEFESEKPGYGEIHAHGVADGGSVLI